jgi:hypothetical protein
LAERLPNRHEGCCAPDVKVFYGWRMAGAGSAGVLKLLRSALLM